MYILRFQKSKYVLENDFTLRKHEKMNNFCFIHFSENPILEALCVIAPGVFWRFDLLDVPLGLRPFSKSGFESKN